MTADGHYRFAQAARMEWIKLRSLRSTWWSLGATVAGAIGVAVAVGVNTEDAAADLTNNALAEYSSGTIRATLAAIPNRPLVLAAKAAVFGAVALAVGEAAAFVAFFAGGAALPSEMAAPTLGQPGVLRAVALGGAGYGLIGLLGLGLGAIIRHTPGAIAVLVGGVYVLAQLVAPLAPPIMPYLPVSIVANSLSAVRPVAAKGQVHFLSPWAGLAMLSLYAAVTLGAGAWRLASRDA
jgi:ABC-2 type transport system permease protein